MFGDTTLGWTSFELHFSTAGDPDGAVRAGMRQRRAAGAPLRRVRPAGVADALAADRGAVAAGRRPTSGARRTVPGRVRGVGVWARVRIRVQDHTGPGACRRPLVHLNVPCGSAKWAECRRVHAASCVSCLVTQHARVTLQLDISRIFAWKLSVK